MDVFRLEFRERHLILTQERAAFAVWIVLPRTTTIVLYVGVAGWNAHTHTELRHHGTIISCRLVIHIDQNLAFVNNGIFHRHVLGFPP